MDKREQELIDALATDVDEAIQPASGKPWGDRAAIADKLLRIVNRRWWSVHLTDGDAYQRDLDELNRLASWNGEFAQVAHWTSPQGVMRLMPPKFFSGNPLAIDKSFVASVWWPMSWLRWTASASSLPARRVFAGP
jgi:hypothetical protein